MNIPNLIFDLDGTLIDSVPDIHTAVNKLLQSHERALITLDQCKKFVGNGAPKLIERAFEATGNPAIELEKLTQEFLGFYTGHETDQTQIYEGVIETLEKLKADGFLMALCTNKPQLPAENALRDLGLTKYFDVILGGDQLANKKPHPEMILWVMDQMNASADNTFMIGDSPNDIEGGKNAGLKTIAVPYGYRKVSLEEMNADITVQKFSDILEIVR